MIKALVKAGAKLETRHENGVTALFYAALKNSNPDIIEELVKAGANVQAKDEEGRMPIDYLETNENFPEIKETGVYWELKEARYE